MAKVKVGDVVRVVSPDVFAAFGEVFTVQERRVSGHSILGTAGEVYVTGDVGGYGVWEKYVEVVEES